MIPFNISIIPLYSLMLDLQWTNTFWALIIPSAFSPFGIFLMRQFMHSIPDELIDAARIDGASEFGIFFRIVMPLSTAALAALAIYIFIVQWDDFLWPLVIIDEPALLHATIGPIPIPGSSRNQCRWPGGRLNAGRPACPHRLLHCSASLHRGYRHNGYEGIAAFLRRTERSAFTGARRTTMGSHHIHGNKTVLARRLAEAAEDSAGNLRPDHPRSDRTGVSPLLGIPLPGWHLGRVYTLESLRSKPTLRGPAPLPRIGGRYHFRHGHEEYFLLRGHVPAHRYRTGPHPGLGHSRPPVCGCAAPFA